MIFQLLFPFLNGCNSHFWHRVKAEAPNSIQFFHMGGKDPHSWIISHFFLIHIKETGLKVKTPGPDLALRCGRLVHQAMTKPAVPQCWLSSLFCVIQLQILLLTFCLCLQGICSLFFHFQFVCIFIHEVTLLQVVHKWIYNFLKYFQPNCIF